MTVAEKIKVARYSRRRTLIASLRLWNYRAQSGCLWPVNHVILTTPRCEALMMRSRLEATRGMLEQWRDMALAAISIERRSARYPLIPTQEKRIAFVCWCQWCVATAIAQRTLRLAEMSAAFNAWQWVLTSWRRAVMLAVAATKTRALALTAWAVSCQRQALNRLRRWRRVRPSAKQAPRLQGLQAAPYWHRATDSALRWIEDAPARQACAALHQWRAWAATRTSVVSGLARLYARRLRSSYDAFPCDMAAVLRVHSSNLQSHARRQRYVL